MKIPKIFIKSNPNITTVQTTSVMDTLKRQSFIDHLLSRREFDLAAWVAVQYFSTVSPVAGSIERIYTDVSSIPLLIYDQKENEFVSNHPLQILLNQPNFDDTQNQFMEALTAFYRITGDSYVIANSIDQDSEPRNLFIKPPQSVQINQNGNGDITSYTVSQGAITIQYMGVNTLNGTRYIATLPNGTSSEIYHALTFNPLTSRYNVKGRSDLSSLFYEMEQFIAANTHNLSRLKRGTTLDGVFKTEDNLTTDQYQRLQSHIDEYWGGEQNSGRPFLADGGLQFEATPAGKKDMDYSTMKRDLLHSFYNTFKIPLPFVSAETMTLANMEAATLRFYDEAILPTLNRLLADLTKFLMPRYKNSENLKIWYDMDSISALEPRRNEQLKAKKDLGVYTTNELRAMDRAEPIDGGQNIYGSITDVPIAVDQNDEFATGDELERDEDQQQQQDDAAKFRVILETYKDKNGNPLFSDKEIEKEVANL